jgi:hypothetical protein
VLGRANGRRFWLKEAENKLAVFLAGELEDPSQLALPYLGVLSRRSIEAAPRIQCLEIFLESLLVFGPQTDEFDAHAKSRIAGAHKGAGCHLLRLNRQVNLETGSDGKRKDSLDVTAAAANVGGGTEPTVQPH